MTDHDAAGAPEPDLSIIVTCYNLEDYLEECLDSVINQTFRNIEIIVVDDGSTDGTPQIIDRYADKDDRVVPVLLRQNSVGGVATAANAGLDRARGRLVGFVDGDDFCEPHMFERLVGAMDRHGADLSMCQYQLFDDERHVISEPAEVGRWADVDQLVYELDVEQRRRFLKFIAVPWRKLYRRDLLETHAIRFPVGDYFFEDNPFHWFCVLSARSLAVVPEVLCYHRVARVGQTMDTADRRLFRMFDHHETIRAWLAERGLEDTYAPTLLAWAISQAEWIAPRTPKHLRRELFDTLVEIVTRYDMRTTEEALEEGKKGASARGLVRALRHSNFAAFNRTLDTRAKPVSPFVSALYHLRYSGPLRTARLTQRYLRNRSTEVVAPLTRKVGRQDQIALRDIMFALMVIERRLRVIEDALHRSDDRDSARIDEQ